LIVLVAKFELTIFIISMSICVFVKPVMKGQKASVWLVSWNCFCVWYGMCVCVCVRACVRACSLLRAFPIWLVEQVLIIFSKFMLQLYTTKSIIITGVMELVTENLSKRLRQGCISCSFYCRGHFNNCTLDRASILKVGVAPVYWTFKNKSRLWL